MAIPNVNLVFYLKLHILSIYDKIEKLENEIKNTPSWVKGSNKNKLDKLEMLRKEVGETFKKIRKIQSKRLIAGAAIGAAGLGAYSYYEKRRKAKEKIDKKNRSNKK